MAHLDARGELAVRRTETPLVVGIAQAQSAGAHVAQAQAHQQITRTTVEPANGALLAGTDQRNGVVFHAHDSPEG